MSSTDINSSAILILTVAEAVFLTKVLFYKNDMCKGILKKCRKVIDYESKHETNKTTK